MTVIFLKFIFSSYPYQILKFIVYYQSINISPFNSELQIHCPPIKVHSFLVFHHALEMVISIWYLDWFHCIRFSFLLAFHPVILAFFTPWRPLNLSGTFSGKECPYFFTCLGFLFLFSTYKCRWRTSFGQWPFFIYFSQIFFGICR